MLRGAAAAAAAAGGGSRGAVSRPRVDSGGRRADDGVEMDHPADEPGSGTGWVSGEGHVTRDLVVV